MQGRGNAMRGMPMMVLMMAVVVVGSTAVLATNWVVGDSAGWAIRSYDSWVANKTFVVGDTLQFVWTGTHDVVVVPTEADYTACTTGNGPTYTDNSNVTINLNRTGAWYFICSVDSHCTQGMHVSVNVEAATNTTTTPAPASNTTTPTSPNTGTPSSPPNSSPPSLPPSIFTLFFLLGLTLPFFHSF